MNIWERKSYQRGLVVARSKRDMRFMSHCRQAGWDMTLRACGHTRYSFNQLKSFIHAFHEAGVDTDAQVLILLLARAKAEVKRVYQIYRSGQYVKMFPWNTIAFARED